MYFFSFYQNTITPAERRLYPVCAWQVPLWEALSCQVPAFETAGESPFLSLSLCFRVAVHNVTIVSRINLFETNGLTLIFFSSPWTCPQISDLSALFCLHNPLCSTWPCCIPTALTSSQEETKADRNLKINLFCSSIFAKYPVLATAICHPSF